LDATATSQKGIGVSAMLPRMAAKPRIAIVGAGSFGSALAVQLRRAGYKIDTVVGRPGSSKKARVLAKKVGSKVKSEFAGVHAEVIWICVPDSEIESVAKTFASEFDWRGKIALHSSGALTSDVLDVLRMRGASVASVHPLMTFVAGSRPSLRGVPFAIEGDAVAVRQARRIVRDLGGDAYNIRKQEKAAYHAWGTFASPLLTALLATTERVAGLAGVQQQAARRRMMPILLQTLINYASFGAADGFSGPIVRGDVETVKKHLHVLRAEPLTQKAYGALARAALRYLPAKNKEALKKLLDSATE